MVCRLRASHEIAERARTACTTNEMTGNHTTSFVQSSVLELLLQEQHHTCHTSTAQ